MDAETVAVRVQVIDTTSVVLDLTVPTYLPARDLTQRVARDAGLEAFWQDGRRRLYWLRARGRLLRDDETLRDLQVVQGELVYLLPEPPEGSAVVERTPDHPPRHGYAGKGALALIASLGGVLLWTIAWGVLLSVERNAWTLWTPGLALGLLCASLARHAWGGRAQRPRVALTALLLVVVVAPLAFAIPMAFGIAPTTVVLESLSGAVFAFVGVWIGWLAWWGAVEPLPESTAAVDTSRPGAAIAVVPCAICGQDVRPEVRTECVHGCGKAFHTGCWKARIAVYRGSPSECGICGAAVTR